MSDFHLTRMGHRFYESTMPRLVEQLERLNGNLEERRNASHHADGVLDAIAEVLAGRKWDGSVTLDIAALVFATGRKVGQP